MKKGHRAKFYVPTYKNSKDLRAAVGRCIEGSSLSEGRKLARMFFELTTDEDTQEEILKAGQRFDILFFT